MRREVRTVGLLRASAQDVVAGRRDGTSLRALAATLWVFIPEAQMRAAEVIRHLFVVATYKAAGEVVGCKQFCGDLWNREQDRKTIEQSLTLQRAIEEEGKRRGLTVRAGMYQEAGAGRPSQTGATTWTHCRRASNVWRT